jgi:hypothetical protein
MAIYDIPAPGVRQKRPQIVPVTSRVKGDYHIVRTFSTGIAPKGKVVFRGTKAQCEEFVANDCKSLLKDVPKKSRKKKK